MKKQELEMDKVQADYFKARQKTKIYFKKFDLVEVLTNIEKLSSCLK